MDFRSNEAGRTEQNFPAQRRAGFDAVKLISLTPPVVAAGASSRTMKI